MSKMAKTEMKTIYRIVRRMKKTGTGEKRPTKQRLGATKELTMQDIGVG